MYKLQGLLNPDVSVNGAYILKTAYFPKNLGTVTFDHEGIHKAPSTDKKPHASA